MPTEQQLLVRLLAETGLRISEALPRRCCKRFGGFVRDSVGAHDFVEGGVWLLA